MRKSRKAPGKSRKASPASITPQNRKADQQDWEIPGSLRNADQKYRDIPGSLQNADQKYRDIRGSLQNADQKYPVSTG
jgi:hypothetical protein